MAFGQYSIVPEEVMKDAIFGISVKSTKDIIKNDNILLSIDRPC